jgi:hypothetical protein
MTSYRSQLHEVWSRTHDGTVLQHGVAPGLTFADACKHLCTESIDFWTHFDKGCYRGHRLYPSRQLALADAG